MAVCCRSCHAVVLVTCVGCVQGMLQDGWTALMMAAENGHESCVLALVSAGAALDMQHEVSVNMDSGRMYVESGVGCRWDRIVWGQGTVIG